MKVLEHIGEGNIKQRQGTQHQLSGVVLLQYTTTEMVSLLQMIKTFTFSFTSVMADKTKSIKFYMSLIASVTHTLQFTQQIKLSMHHICNS